MTLLNQRIKLLEDENVDLKEVVERNNKVLEQLAAENRKLKGSSQKTGSDKQSSLSCEGRKRKRNKSVVQFIKRSDLTLQIEEIERDEEEARRR